MVDLTQAFVTALQSAQIHAAPAKRAVKSPRLGQCAVAVSVPELNAAPGGFSSYLGMQDGQELYGMHLKAVVHLDVLSPVGLGAGECRSAVDAACTALSAGVDGVSITSVVSHEPDYDKTGDCFTAGIDVDCHCWLCAAASEDDPGTLEHFILKGALT